MEIQYPHSWYNVRAKEAWFGLVRTDAHGINAKCSVETGYYHRPDKLIREINNKLASMMVEKTELQRHYSKSNRIHDTEYLIHVRYKFCTRLSGTDGEFRGSHSRASQQAIHDIVFRDMNRARWFEDYYDGQVGEGLPVFVGGRVQKGHGLVSLFGGCHCLGAFKTGFCVAGDVLSGQNIQ